MYKIKFSKTAVSDLNKLRANEPNTFRKASELIEELKFHPKTGTGKPKRLSGDRKGQWSRKITSRHRLVYTIEDNVLTVLLLSASGHYNDK